MLEYGCIADDLTGATDIAIAFSHAGLRTVVLVGPGRQAVGDFDAAVVALKSRTSPAAEAVDESRAAASWLADAGAGRIYFKYCSTFDSTDEGNIGPVLDALLEELALSKSVVVPAFPSNGRTVSGGNLYVHGTLLEESPMRDHPLTPMRRSRVRELLEPQTRRPVDEILQDVVRQGPSNLEAAIAQSEATHLVIDASTDEDLRTIAKATEGLDLLLSGGAGLAGAFSWKSSEAEPLARPAAGKGLVIAGSASRQTGVQIDHARGHLPSFEIRPAAVAHDADAVVEAALRWLGERDEDRPPVIHISQDGEGSPDAGRTPHLAPALEATLSEIASRAVREHAFTRLVVAGGETSGAVVQALGVDRLEIGPIISPGVCWSYGSGPGTPRLALALKSGNFGPDDMFTSAWDLLP